MSPTDIFISNWFDVCQWSNISKTMLLWNVLLVLLVLMVGFPLNMARPQLHLLSLTVKISDVKPWISHCIHQNLQYEMHTEFWPSPGRIFKTSLYYKTWLILENWRYFGSEWEEVFLNSMVPLEKKVSFDKNSISECILGFTALVLKMYRNVSGRYCWL